MRLDLWAEDHPPTRIGQRGTAHEKSLGAEAPEALPKIKRAVALLLPLPLLVPILPQALLSLVRRDLLPLALLPTTHLLVDPPSAAENIRDCWSGSCDRGTVPNRADRSQPCTLFPGRRWTRRIRL